MRETSVRTRRGRPTLHASTSKSIVFGCCTCPSVYCRRGDADQRRSNLGHDLRNSDLARTTPINRFSSSKFAVRFRRVGIFVASICSAKGEQRQRDQTQHARTLERLHKYISEVRTSYPVREYELEYLKKQNVQRRMSRFPAYRM